MPRISSSLRFVMEEERRMIREDENLPLRDFRRCRLPYSDAAPTGADVEYMRSRGRGAFRVRIADLSAAHVHVPTVERYMWQVRSRGVAYIALPNVELADGRIVVVDGHHRIEALRRLGRKSVLVQFHPSYWPKKANP